MWLLQKRCICGAMGTDFLETATKDGSITLFSTKYNQHYHSVKEGAINESLYKHILPAFEHQKNKKYLKILDICFGLGYNTFLTILTNQQSSKPKKLEIISPELDEKLVNNLKNFNYPEEFKPLREIISKISESHYYEDDFIKISVIIDDARAVIQKLHDIDIVYQDAFSSDTNKELWSVEYFADIKKAMKHDGILTTYSIATPVRLSMSKNGFLIYGLKCSITRTSTLAFLEPQNIDGFIDMNLKMINNPNAMAIFD